MQATTLYAALLRQLAHQCLSDVLGSSDSSSEPMAGEARVKELTEAATLLRKAAGVYAFLAERMLPPLQQTLKGDRWVRWAAPVNGVACPVHYGLWGMLTACIVIGSSSDAACCVIGKLILSPTPNCAVRAKPARAAT